MERESVKIRLLHLKTLEKISYRYWKTQKPPTGTFKPGDLLVNASPGKPRNWTVARVGEDFLILKKITKRLVAEKTAK